VGKVKATGFPFLKLNFLSMTPPLTDGLRKTCGGRPIPRTKMKTLKMSLSIVITFVVCWTPYFVVYNLLIFSNYSLQIPDSLMVVCDMLPLTNSVINPFIYSCYNMKIKSQISEACCLRFEYVFLHGFLPNCPYLCTCCTSM